MRERFRAVTPFLRPAGRRTPDAASVGVANSLVLFTAIVAAVTLAGAGLGESRAGGASPSPLPSHMVGAVPSTAASLMASPAAASPAQNPVPAGTEPRVASSELPTCGPGFPSSCDLTSEPSPLPSPAVDASPAVALHVPIFEYHRIRPPAGETGYAEQLIVPPSLFEAQMAAMEAAGWHTITMAQLGDDLRLGLQPPSRSFVVTLDDGYEDGYTYALPILQRHGFVATYFVIGSRIGSPDDLTVAELQGLVAAGNEIGNHTMDHVDLRPLTPDRLWSEIYNTSAVIERSIGVWPQSLCYPFGKTKAAVSAEIAAMPGIETAVIETGSQPETWANRLSLPRIRIGPGSYPQYLVDKAGRYLQ